VGQGVRDVGERVGTVTVEVADRPEQREDLADDVVDRT
jgi:hypothetical protein